MKSRIRKTTLAYPVYICLCLRLTWAKTSKCQRLIVVKKLLIVKAAFDLSYDITNWLECAAHFFQVMLLLLSLQVLMLMLLLLMLLLR